MVASQQSPDEQSLESELESIRDTVKIYAMRMLSEMRADGRQGTLQELEELQSLASMGRFAELGLEEEIDEQRLGALQAIEQISAEWEARGWSELYCKVVALENFEDIEGPSGAVN